MEFNSPEGLAAVYGDSNPTTYFLGNKSVDEAMSKDREATKQQVEKTAQDTLKTQFTAANNPQRIENQRLVNEGLGYDNVNNGIKSRINAATESQQLSNAQMKQVLEADEGQIQKMQKQAQTWAYSDDPALVAKGQKLMQLSTAAVEARQKHKDEMEKQDLIRKSAERVASGNNAATIQAATIGADGRLAAKTTGQKDAIGSLEAALLKQKLPEQYGTLQQAATLADQQGNPGMAQMYRARAAAIEPSVRAALSPAGQQQTTINSSGQIVTAPRAATVPSINPNESKPVENQIPVGAIQLLKTNPAMAAQFDAKYGVGASKQFLGK